MHIERIPVTDKSNIFLIEVERHDPYCVYYSILYDWVYVRENDESKKLAIPDALDMIARKAGPRLFVQIKPIRGNQMTPELQVSFMNEGFEPAKFVSTLISCRHSGTPPFTIVGGTIRDLTHINPGSNKVYQSMAGYPPTTAYVYPKINTIFGTLKINVNTDFVIILDIETFENRGKSDQTFTIINSGGQLDVRESKRIFKPYMGLL